MHDKEHTEEAYSPNVLEGIHTGTTVTREENGELLMTKECRFRNVRPEEVRRAFFFDDFFRAGAPVGADMICSDRKNHLVGGPGSYFDISEFRPTYLKYFKSMGHRMTFTWVGETLEGTLVNGLWAARWTINFEEEDSRGTYMKEDFLVEGAPQPIKVWEGRLLRRVMNAVSWVSNRVPIIRGLNKRLLSRACVMAHQKHAAYEVTIVKRIEAMRRRNAS